MLADTTFSGHELIIISKNPKFEPTEGQIATSIEIIKIEYPNCEIKYDKFDSTEFIDSGQNFEDVFCNYCNKEIAIDFWQEKMSESFENSHFDELDFIVDCCQIKTNLNELNYQGDCGFSKYSITINNAAVNESKEEKLQKLLTITLGSQIKMFWRHI